MKCIKCNKVLPEDARGRAEHLRNHGDLLVWKCPHCVYEVTSRRRRDLVLHIERQHGDSGGEPVPEQRPRASPTRRQRRAEGVKAPPPKKARVSTSPAGEQPGTSRECSQPTAREKSRVVSPRTPRRAPAAAAAGAAPTTPTKAQRAVAKKERHVERRKRQQEREVRAERRRERTAEGVSRPREEAVQPASSDQRRVRLRTPSPSSSSSAPTEQVPSSPKLVRVTPAAQPGEELSFSVTHAVVSTESGPEVPICIVPSEDALMYRPLMSPVTPLTPGGESLSTSRSSSRRKSSTPVRRANRRVEESSSGSSSGAQSPLVRMSFTESSTSSSSTCGEPGEVVHPSAGGMPGGSVRVGLPEVLSYLEGASSADWVAVRQVMSDSAAYEVVSRGVQATPTSHTTQQQTERVHHRSRGTQVAVPPVISRTEAGLLIQSGRMTVTLTGDLPDVAGEVLAP